MAGPEIGSGSTAPPMSALGQKRTLRGVRPMSALGQKQASRRLQPMSALPPKADIADHRRHVRFVPKADIWPPHLREDRGSTSAASFVLPLVPQSHQQCRQRLAPKNPRVFSGSFQPRARLRSGTTPNPPQSCVACARCARFKLAGVPLSPARPRSARPRR